MIVDPRLMAMIDRIDPDSRADVEKLFKDINKAGGIQKHIAMATVGISLAVSSEVEDDSRHDIIASTIRLAVLRSITESIKAVAERHKQGMRLAACLNDLSKAVAEQGQKEAETLSNLMILVQDKLIAKA